MLLGCNSRCCPVVNQHSVLLKLVCGKNLFLFDACKVLNLTSACCTKKAVFGTDVHIEISQ